MFGAVVCATIAGFAPGLWICPQTTKLMFPSPSVSNSAHASPVWPVLLDASSAVTISNVLPKARRSGSTGGSSSGGSAA